jgi:hypothetical protein
MTPSITILPVPKAFYGHIGGYNVYAVSGILFNHESPHHDEAATWSFNTTPPRNSSLPPFAKCSAFFVRVAFSYSSSTGAIGPP